MKAISLREPWASLMAYGSKTIETRSLPTSHRGPLLICAAKMKMDKEALRIANTAVKLGFTITPQYGMAICVVELIDCISTSLSIPTKADRLLGNFTKGRFTWITRDLIPIIPFPVSGKPGLFNVPDDTVACSVMPIRQRILNTKKIRTLSHEWTCEEEK